MMYEITDKTYEINKKRNMMEVMHRISKNIYESKRPFVNR